jgi:hypothetical protein
VALPRPFRGLVAVRPSHSSSGSGTAADRADQQGGRIRLGKYDTSYGVLLRGLPNAAFEYVPQYESGLSLRGDVRSVLQIGDKLLFGINRSVVRAFEIGPS